MRISLNTYKAVNNTNIQNKQNNKNLSFKGDEEHFTMPSGNFGDDLYFDTYGQNKGSWKGILEGIREMRGEKEQVMRDYYTSEQILENKYKDFLYKVDSPEELPEYLDKKIKSTTEIIERINIERQKLGEVIDNINDYKKLLGSHTVRRFQAIELLQRRIREFEAVKAFALLKQSIK